jgi:hypothetical protein|tara:strand:- start:343 stop:498 length:156 start_codon:yes stop_codon:yes gene_type:complete
MRNRVLIVDDELRHRRILSLDVNGYITKPYEIDDVMDQMMKSIEKAGYGKD